MVTQVTSGTPNAAVDPQINPSSQPQSRSGVVIAVVAFLVFSAPGALAWLAL
jgi:hypothetical protein